MRATYLELLLLNLEGNIDKDDVRHFIEPEEAYRLLKKETTYDFGRDAKAWRERLEKNELVMLPRLPLK